jgi:hypothetical protein
MKEIAMTKKLSRRDFLKETGKITAAMAAIWAAGADMPPEDVPEAKPKSEPRSESADIWNEERHPYHMRGGATMIFSHSKKHEW